MNPKKFLYRLGIQNRSYAEGDISSTFDNEVPPAGGDLKFDSMSPYYMNALFTSEAFACETAWLLEETPGEQKL
jgi:hypothetical protein